MEDTKDKSVHFKKRKWSRFIKYSLMLAMLVGIYYQISHKEDVSAIYSTFKTQWASGTWELLLLAIFLAPTSRFLQAKNWQSFLKLPYVSTLLAARSVLVGVTAGMFTPNAVGAYPGRLVFIPKKDHYNALEATFLESISFMTVIVVAGAFGIAAFCPQWFPSITTYQNGIWIWAVLVAIVALVIYFNIRLTLIWSKRIPFLYRFIKKFVLIEQVEQKRLWYGLGYSALRLCIQLVEYACIFYFFGAELPFMTIIMGMSALYFIRLGIPLPNALNSLVSGELMLLLFGNQGTNDLTLLAVTFSVWIINIVFPALLGLVLFKDAKLIEK